jgi:predicted RNA binding protein YcfA (HicA-like mRNA interferase family)
MYATDLLYHPQCDEPRVQTLAGETKVHVEPGRGSHLTVRRGHKVSTLPMHGKGKELGIGLVNAIKKQLGLK